MSCYVSNPKSHFVVMPFLGIALFYYVLHSMGSSYVCDSILPCLNLKFTNKILVHIWKIIIVIMNNHIIIFVGLPNRRIFVFVNKCLRT